MAGMMRSPKMRISAQLNPIPQLPPERPRKEKRSRRSALAPVVGTVLLASGLVGVRWWTSVDARHQFEQAIQRLGDASVAVRLTAIQDLRDIARDDASRREIIVKALAEHIRTHSPVRDNDLTRDERPVPIAARGKKPSSEIQAAASAIGEHAAGPRLDLSRVDLAGVDWHGARLDGVNLHQANLSEANLVDAHLSQASVTNTQLIDAKLDGGKFAGATFQDSWLEGAALKNADATGVVFHSTTLWGADLSGASLNDADLEWAIIGNTKVAGTNLCGAHNAKREKYADGSQLSYVVDEHTVLPCE